MQASHHWLESHYLVWVGKSEIGHRIAKRANWYFRSSISITELGDKEKEGTGEEDGVSASMRMVSSSGESVRHFLVGCIVATRRGRTSSLSRRDAGRPQRTAHPLTAKAETVNLKVTLCLYVRQF